ncbi:MAG: LuxR family transcriptional regulator [Nitrospirae bacterium]|nr:MAG: LuxR family transcriptional regulator [Nitrospirota bacterium]
MTVPQHEAVLDRKPKKRSDQRESPFAQLARRRGAPGVLVFAADGTLLYRNAQGAGMMQQLLDEESANGSSSELPTVIIEVCEHLQRILDTPSPRQKWEQVEIRRVVEHPVMPILIRGYFLSNPRLSYSQLLLIMERLGRRVRSISPQTKARFHLTNREEEIAQWIGAGRTNKEIANILKISEHTVKEHIRHLLRKTKSHTRTGILACLYQDD